MAKHGSEIPKTPKVPPSVPVDLIDDGVLWLINTVLFHPRGFALAVGDEESVGYSFSLMGDGTELWRYEESPDVPDGVFLEKKWAAVEALFERSRQIN